MVSGEAKDQRAVTILMSRTKLTDVTGYGADRCADPPLRDEQFCGGATESGEFSSWEARLSSRGVRGA